MNKMLKKVLKIITIVVASLFIIYSVMGSSTAYIHRKLDFWCVFVPRRTYYYDSIGHGKDYNSLFIYTLSQFDVERLSNFVCNSEGWKGLPIDQGVLRSDISDKNFDSNMTDMIDNKAGYWYIDGKQRDLFVLDIEENKLYIRTASILQ